MTLPRFFDTHSHVSFPAFDDDREAVLARMRARGIATVSIGTSLVTSAKAIAFAETQPDVWASVGLHPEHVTSSFHDAKEGETGSPTVTEDELVRLAKSSTKVVAIGETGLDFFRIDPDRDSAAAIEQQERVFRIHIAAAAQTGLPLVMHCREALGRLAEILQDTRRSGLRVRGVVHSFTGTWGQAEPLIHLGLMIGVNGIATFPLRKIQSAEDAIDRTIERIPLAQLLLETDAPYLAPVPHRGKRNEPAFVEHVAEHVARIRGESVEAIGRTTTENAIRLFCLSEA